MSNPFADLSGKTALITGASSGLGRHFAELLAEYGVQVAIAARRQELVESVASEVAATGARVLPLTLDVTDPTSVARAIERTIGTFGAIDILVNNAGVSANGPALEQTAADWDRVLDTNLKGAFLMSTELGRRLREARKPGTIVNVASVLALRGASHLAAYAASKAALVQFTKVLALELARHQIRVNALAPGYVLTDINREFFETDPGRELIRRIPQRRLGDPKDLDAPLLLLASDASRFMTGSVVVVDGGYNIAGV